MFWQPITAMAASGLFKTQQYGELEYEQDTYPLIALTSAQWDDNNPIVLITGGVHGI